MKYRGARSATVALILVGAATLTQSAVSAEPSAVVVGKLDHDADKTLDW